LLLPIIPVSLKEKDIPWILEWAKFSKQFQIPWKIIFCMDSLSDRSGEEILPERADDTGVK
jgi:hypothetical protein